MRKDRLYFFTFLAITIIFILIAGVSVRSFIKASANELLKTQLESSQREAKEVASLIGFQLANGMHRDSVIQMVQKSIENTDIENGFICMFDWSGKEICHPDITVDRALQFRLQFRLHLGTVRRDSVRAP